MKPGAALRFTQSSVKTPNWAKLQTNVDGRWVTVATKAAPTTRTSVYTVKAKASAGERFYRAVARFDGTNHVNNRVTVTTAR